ncbi:hypothetical protein FACS1894170_12380 [Planctomycetales bacterium]|nr:hypothetical protein FACS1894170_12380 [Planctomycetales bacterium]
MNRILSTRNALVLLTVFLTVRLLPVFADEIGVKEKELLTLEDIVAGYQYNASLFDSSRVIMLYKTQNLLAVKKLDSDDPMQDALEYTILNQEEVPVESGYIDYWGNMQKFLCCFIPLPDVSKLPLDTRYGFNADWILDAAPTYRDASFVSFSLISKQTRYWGGNCDREKLEKFHCTGAISAGPNQMPSGFVFPPFFSNSFGDIQLFHSIDSFFLLPKNELKFVGRTTLDGVPVVVLQHKKIAMENFPFQGVAMMRVRTA